MEQNQASSSDLLVVNHLKKYFPVRNKAVLKAVDDVSFSLRQGETLGLVGESGCGKTTCGRTILGLYEATGGEVLFQGENVFSMSRQERLEFNKKAQIIFQDPYASLNPRMTVQDIVGEGMVIHKMYDPKRRLEIVHEKLALVGLNKEHATRFPHEFSGGQRQRIGIARALAIDPRFIVCDEPISALDVSIQAQIVNLLMKLQSELGLTYLFIAHDLAMVKHISDRVGVMYLGNMMEIAPSEELYSHAAHPYTQALLSAIPIADPKAEKAKQRIDLTGEVPSPVNPPPGCRFRMRCKYATERCAQEQPALQEIASNHYVACHLFKKP